MKQLTALNKNLTIACPEKSTTEKTEVVAENRIVRFAFKTTHSESLTSMSIPTLLRAQATRLVKVTERNPKSKNVETEIHL